MTKTKWLLACVVCAGLVSPLGAQGDSIARFDGGIGVIPVSNVTVNADGSVAVSRNIVRGVNPPGQIWVIDGLKARVDFDGRIRVQGSGLLLGGGNNTGFNANQSVFASLICGAAAPFTVHSTPTAGVPLEPNGDFRINDVLNPAPPVDCVSPVLLIRNPGGAWFAAGILKLDDKDR